MEPEYLELFSNTGRTAVSVNFKATDGAVREQFMQPSELTKLIQADGQYFLSRLQFDEHLMRLEKIEILVQENHVVLHVRPIE